MTDCIETDYTVGNPLLLCTPQYLTSPFLISEVKNTSLIAEIQGWRTSFCWAGTKSTSNLNPFQFVCEAGCQWLEKLLWHYLA